MFLSMNSNAELLIGVVIWKCGVVQMHLLKLSNAEKDHTSVPVLENYSDFLFFKHLTLKSGKSNRIKFSVVCALSSALNNLRVSYFAHTPLQARWEKSNWLLFN